MMLGTLGFIGGRSDSPSLTMNESIVMWALLAIMVVAILWAMRDDKH